MIVVKISGGLGNQMFQYAAARALANEHNVDLMLDLSWFKRMPARSTPRSFQLHHYPINAHIANAKEEAEFPIYHSRIFRNMPFMNRKWKYRHEKYFHFDPNFFRYPVNTYLDGYWQSNLYFEKIHNQIWDDFQPIKPPGAQDQDLLGKIDSTNSVAIHIRRGDYVTNIAANHFHGVCSLDYYQNALSFIEQREENLNFFVFSDDLVWAKNNLVLPGPAEFVCHNVGDQAFNDLRLMASCSHQIIANSSFSWWGAWLNKNPQKRVIAPAKWFAKKKNTSTLLPNNWTAI